MFFRGPRNQSFYSGVLLFDFLTFVCAGMSKNRVWGKCTQKHHHLSVTFLVAPFVSLGFGPACIFYVFPFIACVCACDIEHVVWLGDFSIFGLQGLGGLTLFSLYSFVFRCLSLISLLYLVPEGWAQRAPPHPALPFFGLRSLGLGRFGRFRLK